MTNSSTAERVLRSFAPAKLNLSLRVVGRRADGRHLLESLFWPLAWGDELTLRPATTPSMTLEWAPDAPRPATLAVDGSNLVMRALEASVQAGAAPMAVHLRKRLPSEAGLGGGSSNAAAVLRVLCPVEVQAAEALRLGADVPFFLGPRPGWMTGIGEQRHDWEGGALDLSFVVVVPPFPLSTAIVFDHFRREGRLTAPGMSPPPAPTARQLAEFVMTQGNALTASARVLTPEIVPVLDALASVSPLAFGMSGSGTACFAIFETLSIAKEKTQVLTEEFRMLNCRWIATGTYGPGEDNIAGEHHGNHRGKNLPGERR